MKTIFSAILKGLFAALTGPLVRVFESWRDRRAGAQEARAEQKERDREATDERTRGREKVDRRVERRSDRDLANRLRRWNRS